VQVRIYKLGRIEKKGITTVEPTSYIVILQKNFNITLKIFFALIDYF